MASSPLFSDSSFSSLFPFKKEQSNSPSLKGRRRLISMWQKRSMFPWEKLRIFAKRFHPSWSVSHIKEEEKEAANEQRPSPSFSPAKNRGSFSLNFSTTVVVSQIPPFFFFFHIKRHFSLFLLRRSLLKKGFKVRVAT